MKSISFKVEKSEETCLLEFLATKLHVSKKKVKKQLLDTKRVFVNQRLVWIAKHPLHCGDIVTVPPDSIMEIAEGKTKALPDIPVLYNDGNVIVVNKPPGLASNGSNSLEERLRKKMRLPELECVHRLDTDTSGCLALALHPSARDYMFQLFRTHKVRKVYHVIVCGFLDTSDMNITTPIDGHSALTRIKTISAGTQASHLWAELETGRTHQIRRHLYNIGHPVLGDRLYGTNRKYNEKEMAVARQMLHAYLLEWETQDKQKITVKAPLPPDFKETLLRFGLG